MRDQMYKLYENNVDSHTMQLTKVCTSKSGITTPIQGNTKISLTGLFCQNLSRCKTHMTTYDNGASQ